MTKPLKQTFKVRTNTIKDSVCKIDIEAVTFKSLWDNYVSGNPYRDPKTGKVPDGYDNQCAIRMSATFHKVGVEMKSFAPAHVDVKPGKSIGRILLNGKFTSTRADELASWLKRQPFCGLPQKPEDITGVDWEKKVSGRTGIIFFGDYWARDGESSLRASGGHIDLWNKNTLTPSFHSFLRFRIGIHAPWYPIYSDLRKAKTILFFEVK